MHRGMAKQGKKWTAKRRREAKWHRRAKVAFEAQSQLPGTDAPAVNQDQWFQHFKGQHVARTGTKTRLKSETDSDFDDSKSGTESENDHESNVDHERDTESATEAEERDLKADTKIDLDSDKRERSTAPESEVES